MHKRRFPLLLLTAAVVLACHGCGAITGIELPYVASPRALVHTPASPAEGNIAITFQLIDREREQGTVILEYSTDSGQTFSACTLVNPAEAAGLDSAWHPGKTHSVQWDSVADNIALSGDATVCVKVTPSDASNPSGTAGVSGPFTVNNITYNQPPTATVATPAGVQFGNIPINYFLADTESDNCSIVVQYSTDDGANWSTATMGPAGEGLTGLSSSPPGSAHMFLWDSRADNVASAGQLDSIKIKITPIDFHEGAAGVSNSFSVDNTITNNPPTVTITDGPAQGSTVTTNQVTFTWSGSDTDGSVIGYYYSFDHDPPDSWTTDTSATSGVLSEGAHIFRVIAVDDQYELSTVASRAFTVAVPGIIQADFTASPTFGTTPLNVSFSDQSSATNGVDTWSWTFGDGDTSTQQNPSHVYMTAGSFSVSLTVTGPDGSDTETKISYITVSGGPMSGSDWNTLGRDNQHTAYTPDVDLTFPLSLMWERQHTGGLRRPCGAEGVLFYPELGTVRTFRAVNLLDGSDKWSFPIADLHYCNPPAVFDARVYFEVIDDSSNNELVYCLSATNGSVIWSEPWSAQWSVQEAGCVENGDLIICGGSYGGMYSFAVSNGYRNWFTDLPQEDPVAPCLWNGVSYSHYPVDSGDQIYAVRLSDGQILWQWQDGSTSHYHRPTPCVISDGVLLTCDPLIAWDIATRTKKWEKPYTCHSPAVADGHVYAVNRSTNGLAKMNLQTGEEVWTLRLDGTASAQPVATKNHLIVPLSDQTCFVNRHLGTVEWMCDYGGEVIVVNGHVVIFSTSTTIRCMKTGDTTPPVTAATPPGGAYGAPVDVTLRTNKPATIYYTTDGTTPTINNYTGTGPSPVEGIHIAVTKTLKFFAIDMVGGEEPVKTENYTIPASGLVITTDALPSGAVQATYQATLQAAGGTQPYAWELSSGILPSGLVLAGGSGDISGTPSSAQTRTFTVMVTDNVGTTDTRQLSITVKHALVDFAAAPREGSVPLGVDFTDLTAGQVTAWNWEFGDGGASTEQNPSHTYDFPGVYTVSLDVTTASGSGSLSRECYIRVHGGPVVKITCGPPATTFDTTPTFMYEASAYGDTIVGFLVGINQNPPTTWITRKNWTSPPLANGSYTFYVQAQTSGGQKSNIDSLSFTVDASTAPPPGTDWNTFGKNNQHTAHTPNEDFTFPLSLEWEKEHVGGIKRPCGEQGLIFYPHRDKNSIYWIRAVRLADASVIWDNKLGDLAYRSPAAVFNGRVFIQYVDDHSNYESICCYEAETGEMHWQAPWGAQWEWYEAPCVENGNLYVCGGTHGGMYSFKVSDGTRNWFTNLPQYDKTTPCLSGGIAYTHYPDDGGYNIYATRLSDGEVQWILDDSSDWHGWSAVPCSLASGILVAPDPVAAWDLSTKTAKWEKTYRSPTPAIADGYVYAVSNSDNILRKINLNTGAEGWTFPLADYATCQPVVTSNHVVVSTSDTTYFVNIGTGAEDWSCAYGGETIVINGYVVIAEYNGSYIRCLK